MCFLFIMFIYRLMSGDADSHVYGWIAYTKEDLRVYLCQIKDDWDVREVRCRRSGMSEKWDVEEVRFVGWVRCRTSEMLEKWDVGLFNPISRTRWCRTCEVSDMWYAFANPMLVGVVWPINFPSRTNKAVTHKIFLNYIILGARHYSTVNG